jgi:murein DD-endopeptidase MepM/ murein hydrolase activator NlpD
LAGIARLWLTIVLALVASAARAHVGPAPDATRLELARAEIARNEAATRSEHQAALAVAAGTELAALRSAAVALDDRRLAATERLRTLRVAVAAMAAAASPAEEEPRRRLVIARLARDAAEGAATLTSLGRARAALGGRLRTVATARARAVEGMVIAEAMRAAADLRWRWALRDRIAALAPARAGPARAAAGLRLAAAGPLDLIRRPALASAGTWSGAAKRKRSLGSELRLDPRLLRDAVPAIRPKRRLAEPATPAPARLLPIAGVRLVSARPPWELTLTTHVTQTVSAPVSGEVVYARRFRDLGPLLIIDRGGGYHAVLLGMTRLDVHERARLVAGQSVGRIEARSDEPACIHLQLRYQGVPLHPAAWSAAHQDKVAS